MALSLTFGVVGVPQTVFAASGSTSVSVSSGSVNIGDTVTVTVKASGPSGEKANATMTLSYDSSVLQFVSCNTTYGGGGDQLGIFPQNGLFHGNPLLYSDGLVPL